MLQGESNYLPWSTMFKAATRTVGAEHVLTGAILRPSPGDPTLATFITMNSYISSMMMQCVELSIVVKLADLSGHACWTALKMEYGRSGSGSRMVHARKLTPSGKHFLAKVGSGHPRPFRSA